MPFILLLIAGVLILAGVRGTINQLGSLLLSDFTGPKNFGIWLFAFFLVGAIGYIPSAKKFSDSFLLLIVVIILIANDKNGNGFFTGLTNALNGNTQMGASSGITPLGSTSFGGGLSPSVGPVSTGVV